jgi:hypothetical protein
MGILSSYFNGGRVSGSVIFAGELLKLLLHHSIA